MYETLTLSTNKGMAVDMNDAQNVAQAAAGAAAGGKMVSAKMLIFGLVFSAISSTSVMMALTMPTKRGDFFASIMATVFSSICGGAYVAVKTGMIDDLLAATTEQQVMFALAPIIGIAFVCGLPAWAIVRGLFVWTEARKNKGIDVLVDDVRKSWGR